MTSLEAATAKCCEEIVVCDGELKEAHSKLAKRRKSLTAAVDLLEVKTSLIWAPLIRG